MLGARGRERLLSTTPQAVSESALRQQPSFNAAAALDGWLGAQSPRPERLPIA
jgi:hypothetical protein